MSKDLRVRRSLLELQTQYEQDDKKPLEDVMRAWKGIKERPPDDPRSFFNLGGYHGEPFKGAGWGFGNNAFWGGYCNHGNVLFRVYLFKLEEAMRSIKGCEAITLPYWDETDSYSLTKGIPCALTVQTFELDGQTIANPLRSFVFPVTIADNVSTDGSLYTKPKGYETVKFPFSGLVGTADAQKASAQHNSQWNYDQSVAQLNQNIVNWLTLPTVNIPPDGTNPSGPIPAGVHEQFVDCLNAPNYTVFSNTTSMQQWNELNGSAVVALEASHNSIHLAVGGYDVTSVPGQSGDASPSLAPMATWARTTPRRSTRFSTFITPTSTASSGSGRRSGAGQKRSTSFPAIPGPIRATARDRRLAFRRIPGWISRLH